VGVGGWVQRGGQVQVSGDPPPSAICCLGQELTNASELAFCEMVGAFATTISFHVPPPPAGLKACSVVPEAQEGWLNCSQIGV